MLGHRHQRWHFAHRPGSGFPPIWVSGDRIAMIAAPARLPPVARSRPGLPGHARRHRHPLSRAPRPPGTRHLHHRDAGGRGRSVTTVLEMPISVPCCARRVFEMRKALRRGRELRQLRSLRCAGLLDRDEVLGMADAGACSCKIFPTPYRSARMNSWVCVSRMKTRFTGRWAGQGDGATNLLPRRERTADPKSLKGASGRRGAPTPRPLSPAGHPPWWRR